MPETTHFKFDEIDLLPDQPGGYQADAFVSGLAIVSYCRNGDWWIENIEIAHSRRVKDFAKPAGQHIRIETRHFEPLEPVKSMVIRRLSEPEWQRSIQDLVDDELSAERVNEHQYEDA